MKLMKLMLQDPPLAYTASEALECVHAFINFFIKSAKVKYAVCNQLRTLSLSTPTSHAPYWFDVGTALGMVGIWL